MISSTDLACKKFPPMAAASATGPSDFKKNRFERRRSPTNTSHRGETILNNCSTEGLALTIWRRCRSRRQSDGPHIEEPGLTGQRPTTLLFRTAPFPNRGQGSFLPFPNTSLGGTRAFRTRRRSAD
jgi:hypothetical protein